MRKVIFWGITLFCWTAWASVSPSNSPLVILESMTNQLKHTLSNQTTSSLKHSYRAINQIVIPHVCLERMARSTVTREAWQRATPNERHLFIQVFTQFIIHNYSDLMREHIKEPMRFLPIRGISLGTSSIQVNSLIYPKDSSAINVRYYLAKVNQEWKIYDIGINGASLVTTFRFQFSDELQKSDLKGLTNKLALQYRRHPSPTRIR